MAVTILRLSDSFRHLKSLPVTDGPSRLWKTGLWSRLKSADQNPFKSSLSVDNIKKVLGSPQIILIKELTLRGFGRVSGILSGYHRFDFQWVSISSLPSTSDLRNVENWSSGLISFVHGNEEWMEEPLRVSFIWRSHPQDFKVCACVKGPNHSGNWDETQSLLLMCFHSVFGFDWTENLEQTVFLTT